MKRTLTNLLALAAVIALVACGKQGTDTPTTDEVEQRLSQPNGGYALEDEAPAFGQETLFASLGILKAQEEVIDELENDPEVMDIVDPQPVSGQLPPARRFVLVAVWGQPRLNWDVPEATDWSGAIRVQSGVVLPRRVVRFELQDRLLPRLDPRVVPFVSYTQPHHDGLVVNIYEDPLASPGVPGEVQIQLAALPQPVVIPYDQLDGYRSLIHVDNLGNLLFIAAEEIPVGGCAAGFIMGHWHRLAPGAGFFLGQWAGVKGALHGHLGGIYGVKPNGDQVFFGKYIGLGGQARGILAGGYSDGRFAGEWHGANGPMGRLGGIYRETIPGPEQGGFFLGGWVQTQCDVTDQPEPDETK